MKKNEILRKLTSRKFIIALITAIVGVITLIIGENETVKTVAGAAMVILPTVVYCIMEGRIDAASVKTIAEATEEAAEKLGADKNTTQKIGFVADAVGAMIDEPDTGGEPPDKENTDG